MIYVDTPIMYGITECPMRGKCGNAWAHLLTNGQVDALHTMAAKLGLRRDFFHGRGNVPHYDITADQVAEAIALGAKSISRKELCKLIMGEPFPEMKG